MPKTTQLEEKQAWTPGPWHYTGDNDGDFVVWAGNKFLANVGGAPFAAVSADPKNELVAFDLERVNARLIAAAPELVEALRELLSGGAYEWANTKGIGANEWTRRSILIERAEAALRKAGAL